MDYTQRDITTMRQQGDVIDFIRTLAGLNIISDRRDEEGTRCSWCGASPGERCTTVRGQNLTAGIHQARIDEHRTTKPRQTPGSWPSVNGN